MEPLKETKLIPYTGFTMLETYSTLSYEAIELAIKRAESQIGVRFSEGGGDAYGATIGNACIDVAGDGKQRIEPGFNCISFITFAFGGSGVVIPRTPIQIYELVFTNGFKIPVSAVSRGDLLLFPSSSRWIDFVDHVAIYLGDDQMIHCSKNGVEVIPVPWTDVVEPCVRLATVERDVMTTDSISRTTSVYEEPTNPFS